MGRHAHFFPQSPGTTSFIPAQTRWSLNSSQQNVPHEIYFATKMSTFLAMHVMDISQKVTKTDLDLCDSSALPVYYDFNGQGRKCQNIP